MNVTHSQRQIRKDIFISLLALISVVIGIYDLTHVRISTRFTVLDVIDLLIVAIFIVDFVYSARSSGNWKTYVRQHWYEVPSLLPVTGNMVHGAEAVPLLRGLRLVRLVRVIRLLRVIGALARLRHFWRKVLRIADRAHILGLIIFGALVILTGAGMAWLVEGSVNERFRGGESVWWALNMFSNVAYVDFQPATLGGRIIAAFLEILGIAFIGLFTASLANAMLKDSDDEDEGGKDSPPLD